MAAAKASRAVKLLGTDVTDGKGRLVVAGAISAMLDNGALRYIKLGDVEVLRAIAFLVRDENWGTYTPKISNLKVSKSKSGFKIGYDATCGGDKAELAYRADINCSAEGVLKFGVSATPKADFKTNRTGFIVLHPLKGVAGKPVTIEHVDGKKDKDKFPAVINPVQPFLNVRAMTHAPMPNVKAEVRFEGDTFETEDHRNWTDASFKTYVRPLALPWPYVLPKGETFTQSVTLTFTGKLPKPKARGAAKPIAVKLGGASGTMPVIASGVQMSQAAAASDKADLVKNTGIKSLICQIDGRKSGIPAALKNYRALAEAAGADVTLEIIIPGKGSPADELAPIAEAVKASGIKPAAIAVSPAIDLKAVLPGSAGGNGPTFKEIYAAARAAFPGVTLGGGMFSYFTELNRKPPPAELLDYVTHTTCPIVHAADDISVMETLEALPYVINSAKAFTKGKPYHIGPTSIPARDNPYGAGVAANPDNGRVCLTDMDPRQRGLFGAAWTLGYVAAFAGNAASVAIGSVIGPQGMIYRKADYAQPGFDDGKAAVYPLYHVATGLAEASGAKRIAATSAEPSTIASVAYRGKDGPVLWLANLTSETKKVKVDGFKGKASMQAVDLASYGKALADPKLFSKGGKAVKKVGTVELGPYAVIRIAAA
jgi:nucleotide-binding universal stress UspA family protein